MRKADKDFPDSQGAATRPLPLLPVSQPPQAMSRRVILGIWFGLLVLTWGGALLLDTFIQYKSPEEVAQQRERCQALRAELRRLDAEASQPASPESAETRQERRQAIRALLDKPDCKAV